MSTVHALKKIYMAVKQSGVPLCRSDWPQTTNGAGCNFNKGTTRDIFKTWIDADEFDPWFTLVVYKRRTPLIEGAATRRATCHCGGFIPEGKYQFRMWSNPYLLFTQPLSYEQMYDMFKLMKIPPVLREGLGLMEVGASEDLPVLRTDSSAGPVSEWT